MNSPIRRLATVVAVMFCALLVSTTWIQYVQADSLRARPDNRRTLLESYAKERGEILVGGTPIAKSVPSNDELKWLRTYPDGKLYSHVTGYYSFTYGAGGGVEGAENDVLNGSADQLFYRRVVDILTGKPQQGASLELTINPKAQQAADQALGNQRGAVVALDPQTGAILAMVSHPQYDPNRLSSHDLNTVKQAWEQLNAESGNPMVNRAIAGDLYPPGSTFKLITAAAALSSGKYSPSSQLPGPAVLPLPQTTAKLPNDDGLPCGPGNQASLTRALVRSCNTTFGALGMKLGAGALRKQAQAFGFGQTLQVPMRVTPSQFPSGDLNPPQTAQSAIGQYDVRVTPLQMAMVSAAIANKGTVMTPYLVDAVRGRNLETSKHSPEKLGTAVSPEVAQELTGMMEQVVTSGTGTAAQIPGITVAGKTGTAEHGTGQAPDAWFTAFAPAQHPQVAVAVVVEDGGKAGNEAFGGTVAAPIAKQVIQAVVR
ncbi:MAG TPA: penicillin-binding protein 2 [Segeticoccus sp.]|uniref:peptidoglycan D,D-transpeptidase FtsI family protein n=1 Tax=Segeticoccus sp. TaxID=2706531 RepID=UPI002D7E5BFA|nr:penicillin-binding protein 2 [Segeticoccus sp.]HET8599195.1 penicillin-binding protein 2 [Segeticoccus sp.]